MKYNVVVTNIKLGTGKEPALTIVCYLVSLPLVPVRLLLYCWQNQLPVVRSDFPHCLPARLVIFLQPQLQPPPTGAYPKLRQGSAASCSLSCVFILLPVLEFYSFFGVCVAIPTPTSKGGLNIASFLRLSHNPPLILLNISLQDQMRTPGVGTDTSVFSKQVLCTFHLVSPQPCVAFGV